MNFDTLVGKTLKSIINTGDSIVFNTVDDNQYELYHNQNCCEDVRVEDVIGDFDDLIGSPIIQAEESESNENPIEKYNDSFTWTFYKLATAKGYVTIRFYGSSNGYYSESVDFRMI